MVILLFSFAGKVFRGPGRFAGLTEKRLRNHFRQPTKGQAGTKQDPRPRAPRRNPKRPGPLRWQTGDAVVRVAALIARHGEALDAALACEWPHEELPTDPERIVALEAANAQLSAERDGSLHKAALALDAQRKSLERLQEVRQNMDAVIAEVKRQGSEDVVCQRVLSEAAAAEKVRQLEASLDAKLAKANAKHEAEKDRMEVDLDDAIASVRTATKVELAAAQLKAETAESQSEKERKEKCTAQAKARAAVKESKKAARKVACLEAKSKAAKSDTDDDDDDDTELEPEEDGSPLPVCRLPFEHLPRRDERGRWQAESNDLRVLRWAQLLRAVAPSTVSHNIQDVVSLPIPDADVASCCERQNSICRGEATLAGEMMAAMKFAGCKRVLFAGWDESTKFGDAVLACTFLIEYYDGRREEVCLRGLSILPAGGSSAAILAHIDKNILAYSRRMLTLWMDEYEKLNGNGSWAADGGPSPENIGLHRLCEDTVLMSDTCFGARCTKRMLAAAIMQAIQEKVGTAAWEAMSVEERNKKYMVYKGDCWNHLRNIMIAAMARMGNDTLKAEVADDLELFSSYERIEADGMQVIRGIFKHLHHGGEYELGRGREYDAYERRHHPSAFRIPFARALGARQDIEFEGCVAVFVNRVNALEFLQDYIDCPETKGGGILDKSLYTLLSCNQFTALLRANTLWTYLFSNPFRWLAGKTGKLKGWSLWKMSEVLDHVESAMEVNI